MCIPLSRIATRHMQSRLTILRTGTNRDLQPALHILPTGIVRCMKILADRCFISARTRPIFLLNISIISARLHLRAAWGRNILHLISVSRTRETVRGICALSLRPRIVLPTIRSSGLISLHGSLRHRLPRQMWRLSRLTVFSGV